VLFDLKGSYVTRLTLERKLKKEGNSDDVQVAHK
jgi:hypothetical protein